MKEEENISIAEMRAHARALEEGLDQHHRRSKMRVWLVFQEYRFYGKKEDVFYSMLVVARSANEARHIVRTRCYERTRKDVPTRLEAVEIDMTKPRVLDSVSEESYVQGRRYFGHDRP